MSEESTPEKKTQSALPIIIGSILLLVGLCVMQMAC